jgi:hypothetical protein
LDGLIAYAENHIRTSTYHKKQYDDQEIEAFVAGMEWDEKPWDDDWGDFDAWVNRHENPKFEVEEVEEDASWGHGKHDGPYYNKGNKGKKGKGKGNKGKNDGNRELVDAVKGLVQTLAVAGSASAPSTGSGDFQYREQQGAIIPVAGGFSRTSLIVACENLARAESALNAAQRVAAGAASSFSNEVQNVSSIRADLESLMRRM